MIYVVVGLSHHTSPVELRERMAVSPSELPDVLATLGTIAGVREAVVVSTCNRTELYAVVEEPERDPARLREFLASLAKLPLGEIDDHLYIHLHGDAVRHLFRVTASLDSMVVGESQVFGQVKSAFAASQVAGMVQGPLSRLMERAFGLAKRVRTETAIGESALSIGSAAVELACSIFGDLEGRSVLLIGAGKMGRLTLRHLRRAGVRSVYIANRSEERARALIETGELPDAIYVPLDRVLEPLAKVDIAVSSVAPGRYVLESGQAESLMRSRRSGPLFVVDIAVPRSFDPDVHKLENIFLYDIDDLRAVIEENQKGRRNEAVAAQRLVEEELESFLQASRELDVVPAIRAILDRLESIRRRELERHLGGRRDCPPEVLQAIEQATRAMLGKVAHGPIQELKRAVSAPDGRVAIDIVRRALLPPDRAPDGEDG